MFLTLVATLGGLLFGYDTAVISGTVKYLDLNFVAPLGGIFAIYELLPAFVIGTLAIVVVSLLTEEPPQEVYDEFDRYMDADV